MFPETGINIISATLHSHIAGRKMKLRHVRDGVELDRIVEDDNYDYNYQQVRQLENETNILPGDYLITDCAYEVSYLVIVKHAFFFCFLVEKSKMGQYSYTSIYEYILV